MKLVFCQSNMIKMLRVLSSNTKILTILLIVILRLKMFFEINDEITNDEMIVDCVIIDEITKIELIIIK